MTAPNAIHVLYDIYMGWSHKTLMQILHSNTGVNEIKKGDLVVFMSRSWNACKILGPNNTMLYWRSNNGTQITIDQLKALPTNFGGSRFTLAAKLEAGALKRLTNLLNGLQAIAA